MIVGIVGGGAFGRALASAVARRGNESIVWSRRQIDVAQGHATTNLAELATAELIFVSAPSMHIPKIAAEIGPHLDGRHFLVHVSRGLIGAELQTVAKHLAHATACRRVGCLAGPLSAEVLAQGLPGAGMVGTGFPEVADAVRAALAGPDLRLYMTDDLMGVEIASALVGLLALGAGFCMETRVPPGALATLMNRGIAEAARVGAQMSAREETFHGMAGSGDLFAAVAGDERAEVRLGRALAKGHSLEVAGREAGAYIEGVSIARHVAEYAARFHIDAPIATVLADVIDGRLDRNGATATLMAW